MVLNKCMNLHFSCSRIQRRDFPGRSVVWTPRFHYRGRRFDPLVRELRSCMLYGVSKKEEDKKKTEKIRALPASSLTAKMSLPCQSEGTGVRHKSMFLQGPVGIFQEDSILLENSIPGPATQGSG